MGVRSVPGGTRSWVLSPSAGRSTAPAPTGSLWFPGTPSGRPGPCMRFDYQVYGDSTGLRDFESVDEGMGYATGAFPGMSRSEADQAVGLCDVASAACLYPAERSLVAASGITQLCPYPGGRAKVFSSTITSSASPILLLKKFGSGQVSLLKSFGKCSLSSARWAQGVRRYPRRGC